MRAIFITVFLAAVLMLAQGGDIKPVKKWSPVAHLDGKTYSPSTPELCMLMGERLIPDTKPETPAGKRIKSEQFIQNPDKPEMVKYDIVYEDIPVPPTPVPFVPEVLTNISPDRCLLRFTTNGAFKGAVWLDGPVTNGVE